jgi:PAS domain S-box-containing protein
MPEQAARHRNRRWRIDRMAVNTPVSSDGSKPEKSSVAADQQTEERPKVLIVDDDERNLLALSTVVEEVADVVTASSGEEALRQLLKAEFAVILLDVFMPGLDGYETAQIIREREQTKRIPIVFLSAVNKENAHLLRGYSMGAVDYVFKPVEPLVLKSKVSVFVDLFAKTREIQHKAEQEKQLQAENLRVNAEKLRVETALRRAEQRQTAIIKSLPIALYLEPVEANPRVPRFVSGNLKALTGYDLEEVKAHPSLWEEGLHAEDKPRVLAALAARQKSGIMAIEYRWRCSSGEYKHFLDQAVLLQDSNGTPSEFAGTLLDVTERKALEQQLVHAQKMDAVGKLTGGIAHDFNNLLGAVLGGLDLIERRSQLEEKQQKILAMTRHAAEQGAELVKRLLAFARRQQLEPAPIDLAKLSTAVGELLAHTLGGLVRLEWELEDELWPAFADEAQLELALMNLIINARDAMPEGGTITVRGEKQDLPAANDLELSGGEYVLLSVTDSGHGIAADILEKVLEPFFTTKEVGKGTGLGLSMVYGFVKQSDGAMRIESKPEEGTTVKIWLPRAPVEQSARPASQAKEQVRSDEPTRKMTILLVDDHDQVRGTTAALLEDAGHEVLQARNAAEALDLLEKDNSCCKMIVSDYAMPSMSGVELVKQARDLYPAIPAVIITGYADTESISDRPDDVLLLGKPFSPEQLEKAVQQAATNLPAPKTAENAAA